MLNIQAKNVSYCFDDAEEPILLDLDFRVGEGLTCIVGRNGSGKSVLAALLAKKKQSELVVRQAKPKQRKSQSARHSKN